MRQRRVRAFGGIHTDDFCRRSGAFVGSEQRAAASGTGRDVRINAVLWCHHGTYFAAGQWHGVKVFAAHVFGREPSLLAVRREHERRHGAVEAGGNQHTLAEVPTRISPWNARQLRGHIDFVAAPPFVQRCQPFAVGAEAGARPAVAFGREPQGFAAGGGHLPQVHGRERVRRLIAVGTGGEHHGLAIGRPSGIHVLAAIATPSAVAGHGRQLGAGQQVARSGSAVAGLHVNMGAARIHPAVPVAHGKTGVDARVVLAGFFRFLGFLVVRLAHGTRVGVADEQQLRTVRRELRCLCARHQAGNALRIAT